jgi:hypothetical protein
LFEQRLSEVPSLGSKGLDEFTAEELKLRLAAFQVSDDKRVRPRASDTANGGP